MLHPNRTWKTAGAPLFRLGFRFAGLKPGSELSRQAAILVRFVGCWYSSNILLSSRNPKNNWCLSRIFGGRFGGKDRGLSTCKPWSKLSGGLEAFCMKRLRTLKFLQKFKIKIKKSKTYSGLWIFQGLSNGTALMQIQSGRTVPLSQLRFVIFFRSEYR